MGRRVAGCGWASDPVKEKCERLMSRSADKIHAEHFGQHVHEMEMLLNELEQAMPK
jgi:hypothetical protein